MGELSTKKKIQYIWDYYKVHILIGIILIGIIAFWVVRVVNKVDTDVYCLIFNDTDNEALRQNIMSTYTEYMGNDKIKASVDRGYMFSYVEEHGISWPDESAVVKLTLLPSNHEADVVITDYDTMLWAKYDNFLTPVEDILPAELYKQLEPYYVYAIFKDDPTGEGDGIVYGLDVSDSEIYKGYSLKYEDAILCFPNVSEDKEAAVRFTKYLYNLPLYEQN